MAAAKNKIDNKMLIRVENGTTSSGAKPIPSSVWILRMMNSWQQEKLSPTCRPSRCPASVWWKPMT